MVNRFDVYGSGSATATDLQLDASRRELGDRITQRFVSGYADISSTTKYQLVANDSPNSFSTTPIVQIVSDDALDTSTKKFYIEGIGDTGANDGKYLSETVALNGTSAVTLANSYKWINVCQQYQGVLNAGNVSLQTGVGADIFALLPLSGNLQTGAWGIPDGYKAMWNGLTVNAHGANTEVELMLGVIVDGDVPLINQLWTWRVKTFNQMPSWFDIPAQVISEYRNGVVSSAGGLMGIYAKAVSGTTTISIAGNIMLTKLAGDSRT
tara:strand:+ start:1661 stop:2461 length:801 start_codon:yes stop_codon:yes gene_type:complete